MPFAEKLLRGSESNGSTKTSGGSRAKRVRALLEEAVRSHLVADVPVGVFLSSGLDSTALAALASRAQGGIHTFTVAFPDLAFSEAEIARRTAERLGHAASGADAFERRNAGAAGRGSFGVSISRAWTGSTPILCPGRRGRRA